ncbi:MAG: hypothetical protein NTW79_02185 [Candidatus Berkelbacteria bacterium]|nr:hypothetical protein [Candidatus Berkelbacteria bacterium]
MLFIKLFAINKLSRPTGGDGGNEASDPDTNNNRTRIGAIIFNFVSWCFLMFAEDGREITQQIQQIEINWMTWSILISLFLGYPTFQMAKEMYDLFL